MRFFILFFTLLFSNSFFANDGAYYTAGNQLIPIQEAQVKVVKEVLKLTRIIEKGEDYILVKVAYVFYNPTEKKNILVGFEAPSPYGDVVKLSVDGGHPYISDFTVEMNNSFLKFKKAIVSRDNYYVNNKIQERTKNEILNDDSFFYVYHFNAVFKPGVNTITHNYKFKAAGSVMSSYNVDYILTAANRWANKQIDDFTLIIDMGVEEAFSIKKTFFNSKDDWRVDDGRSVDFFKGITNFVTNTGNIVFKKKNFKPKGELHLTSMTGAVKNNCSIFNYKECNLLKEEYFVNNMTTVSDDENSFKILRNMPFAVRGYVFKTPIIRKYYLTQAWYKPDANYRAKLSDLNFDEKEWLSFVRRNKWE